MLILQIHGHVIVICIGLPVTIGVVYNLRTLRIRQILLLPIERMKTDTEALIQILMAQQLIEDVEHIDKTTLYGLINIHILECQKQDCPCKNNTELYDANTGKFLSHNVGRYKDPIFLKHFIKRLYEEILSKFLNSTLLQLEFSYFLFEIMKNAHAALIELNTVAKSKPSLKQQFIIYKQKSTIESFIKAESAQAKDSYSQLTRITEFESLLEVFQEKIEKVANLQIEFWLQVSNQIPDLNILHNLSNRIYEAAMEVEEVWEKLCEINSAHSKALTLYGNYMIEIRNHNIFGCELLGKANNNHNKKTFEELTKTSDSLFTDDIVVVHISGNRDNPGCIVNINHNIHKVFGYCKAEVMGNSINILMPNSFARRHNEFLDKFFKTGLKTVFNTERAFYGLNRNGFCFPVEILVKQMPSLAEGIQYVGMIKCVKNDYEYILTDTRGVIECFSQGAISLLGLPANVFKTIKINIQMLAPDLIKVFSSVDRKKTLLSRFQIPGGYRLTFIIPKDFTDQAQSESKKSVKEMGKNLQTKGNYLNLPYKKMKNFSYYEINKSLNKGNGIPNKQITCQMLLQSSEYKEYEMKQTVKCEIINCTYAKEYKDIEPLKIRVFKISNINHKRIGADFSSELSETYYDLRSNNSGDVKESKEEVKKDTTQDFLNMINGINIKMSNFQTKEGNSNIEETKTTEKIPGNVVTTENPTEPNLALNLLEVTEGFIQEESSEKDKLHNINASLKEKKNTLSEKVNELNNAEDDSSTPRVQLGFIKAPVMSLPESYIAGNTMDMHLSSINESGSFNSLNQGKNNKANEGTNIKRSKFIPHTNFSDPLEEIHPIRKILSKYSKAGTTIDNSASLDLGKKSVTFRRQSSESRKDLGESSKQYIPAVTKLNNKCRNKSMGFNKSITEKKIKDFNRRRSVIIPYSSGKDKSSKPIRITELQVNTDKQEASALNVFSNGDFNFLKDTLHKNDSLDEARKSFISSRKSLGLQKDYNKFKLISDVRFDPEQMEYPEYKPTEDELKIRKSLLAFTKKKSKENKLSSMENSLKRDNNNEKMEENDKNRNKSSCENSNENSQENEEQESKEESGNGFKINDEKNEDMKYIQDSIASSTGTTIRSFYSLRSAIDEKFIPPSIKKMGYVAIVVFSLILGLVISYFIVEFVLYKELERTIQGINSIDKRFRGFVSINVLVLNMMIISADYNQHTIGGLNESAPSFSNKPILINKEKFANLQYKLEQVATMLKMAQTELSINTEKISEDNLKGINSENITLHYMPVPGMFNMTYYTMWETVVELVVAALEISDLPITDVNDTTDSATYFIMTNSLNDIYAKISETSGTFINEVELDCMFIITTFTILFIVVSVVLLISTILLIPVVNKVNKNKQSVLELFMHIKKSSANEEINRCRRFTGIFQMNSETEMIGGEGEEVQEEAENVSIDIMTEKFKKIDKDISLKTSKRKFRSLKLNFGLVLFKFIFLILIMEGFFLLSNLLSYSFLSKATLLLKEMDKLSERFPLDSLFLLMEKYYLLENIIE